MFTLLNYFTENEDLYFVQNVTSLTLGGQLIILTRFLMQDVHNDP